jgi:RNA polymerase sigma-70 factor (ECF subfamily)
LGVTAVYIKQKANFELSVAMLLEAAGAVGIAEVEEVTVRDGPNASSHVNNLVLRAQAGEAYAFEQLMIGFQRQVLGTAARILRRREDARDAAQEVFLKLYRYLPRIRPEAVRAWLYRVTVNVCRDMAKQRGRFPTTPLEGQESRRELSVSGAGQVEGGIDLKEQHRMLNDALQELPFKERAALVLRDVEGLSTEETARVLGSSATTVRSQISTARVKVRRHVERAMGKAK